MSSITQVGSLGVILVILLGINFENNIESNGIEFSNLPIFPGKFTDSSFNTIGVSFCVIPCFSHVIRSRGYEVVNFTIIKLMFTEGIKSRMGTTSNNEVRLVTKDKIYVGRGAVILEISCF